MASSLSESLIARKEAYFTGPSYDELYLPPPQIYAQTCRKSRANSFIYHSFIECQIRTRDSSANVLFLCNLYLLEEDRNTTRTSTTIKQVQCLLSGIMWQVENKTEWGSGIRVCVRGNFDNFDNVAVGGLTKAVTFEWRPEGGEGLMTSRHRKWQG